MAAENFSALQGAEGSFEMKWVEFDHECGWFELFETGEPTPEDVKRYAPYLKQVPDELILRLRDSERIRREVQREIEDYGSI